MKIKKWLSVAALATVIKFDSCSLRKFRKESRQRNSCQNCNVNRSGSEEARWDKIRIGWKDGIKLEFTEFTDYSWQMNTDGEVDLNAFQLQLLEQLEQKTGKDLSDCRYLHLAIRLYSGKNGGRKQVPQKWKKSPNNEVNRRTKRCNKRKPCTLLALIGWFDQVDVSGTALCGANLSQKIKELEDYWIGR